ncbi:hypothetical protein LJR029_004660 [Caballeronia sp. LjRoot29]|uniref:hypothetical protein n=1 Tax=Caballeronia sp. LjRoot29 TaxID=3342315 RepID=UPI003ECCC760
MRVQPFVRAQPLTAEYMEQDASEHVPGSDGQRARLADLDSYMHCSVIGTCLANADLRDIVVRFSAFDFREASDFEVHHAALQIAAEGGPGADALQEVLDNRYKTEIWRFETARNEHELRQLWSAVHRSGDTAGAYWALMTHPPATCELRQRVAGELHGLTYLVTSPSSAFNAE